MIGYLEDQFPLGWKEGPPACQVPCWFENPPLMGGGMSPPKQRDDFSSGAPFEGTSSVNKRNEQHPADVCFPPGEPQAKPIRVDEGSQLFQS